MSYLQSCNPECHTNNDYCVVIYQFLDLWKASSNRLTKKAKHRGRILIGHSTGFCIWMLYFDEDEKYIHCYKPQFDYRGCCSFYSTVVGMYCCDSYNTENLQSRWSCKIHSILTAKESVCYRKLCGNDRQSLPVVKKFFLYRVHCTIPESGSVRVSTEFLLDIPNCCFANIHKQLICLTSKHQNIHPVFAQVWLWISFVWTCSSETYHWFEHQNHHCPCNLCDEDQQDYEEELKKKDQKCW